MLGGKNLNFKKFIRRMNRGVVLGIVFLLFMTGFVIIDESNFKNEEGNIEEMITNYLQDVGDLNVAASSTIIPGDKANAAQAAAARALLVQLIDDYYTTSEVQNAYGQTSSDEISAYNTYLENVVMPIVKKQDVVLNPYSFEITKNGVGCAIVRVDCSYDIEYQGNYYQTIYTPGSRTFYDNYSDYGMVYVKGSAAYNEAVEQDTTISYDTNLAGTYSVDGTFYIKRVDGQWKIYAVSLYSYPDNINEVQANAFNTTNTEWKLSCDYIIPNNRKFIEGGLEI